jgi:UDP-glucose 4-epimerase
MILVTGGMGFIGLSAVQRLLEAGEEVLLTYHRTYQEPSWLKPHMGKTAAAERVDVTNPYEMFRLGQKYTIDGIVHLVVPPIGASNPQDAYFTNTTSLYNVLEAGKLWNAKRVTLASSLAVYSGVPAGPFREDTPLRIDSNNTTEAYKKAEETMALFYGSETGLDVKSVRIGSIYGPLHNKSWRIPNFGPTYVCQAVRCAIDGVAMDERYVPDGGPFTEALQDLDYVKDTGLAIAKVQLGTELKHNIYNIGRGKLTRMGDVIDAVRKHYPNANLPHREGAPPRPGKPDGWMDTTRLREDTGFETEYDTERSVADYIEWMKQNPE